MSNERYNVLFQISSYPAWLLEPESGTFADVSERAAEMFGYTREELVGKPLDLVLDSSERKRTAAARKAADSPSGDGGWWHARTNSGAQFRMNVRFHDENEGLLFAYVVAVEGHPSMRIATRRAAVGY